MTTTPHHPAPSPGTLRIHRAEGNVTLAAEHAGGHATTWVVTGLLAGRPGSEARHLLYADALLDYRSACQAEIRAMASLASREPALESTFRHMALRYVGEVEWADFELDLQAERLDGLIAAIFAGRVDAAAHETGGES